MEEIKIEKRYRDDAMKVVNMIFEAKILREDTTRNVMQILEDYLASIIQINAKAVERGLEFVAEVKAIEEKKAK